MPIQLTRTVRFCLGPDGSLATDTPANNTFAAWPPMRGLGRYYELDVTCTGDADPATGYFMNIKRIDQVVRDAALPIVSDFAKDAEKADQLGALMQRIAAVIGPQLDDAVQNITLRLTPTYAITLETNMLDHVLITQQYEFSAAHRLHAGELSDEQNQRVFGKCNNPAGHGHNYRLEVTTLCWITPGGQTLAAEDLDAIVDEAVIQKLDHKHLNVDVPEFADRNPSVEHIAQAVFHMLDEPVRKRGAILDQIRVWETSKTVCTFRRPAESIG
ncbi:hypothetical protein HED60_24320 [Planctomycetales bacterium ZRK34]|nr:hypothetical protein HED60_24320 [Planctomycetales bacterium ZRK34]